LGEIKMEGEKSVEFNMSLATLERINNLIKQAHLSSQGLFSIKMNIPYSDHQVYLNTLDRIYIEVQTKMDDKERVKCSEFEKKIVETKMKWKEDILFPFIDEKRNSNYDLAWNEIIFVARQYEIFLMQSMDRHKMLLRELTDSGL
jgi:beta-galactosidase beta subunit